MLSALAALTNASSPRRACHGRDVSQPRTAREDGSTVDHVSDGRLELGIGAAWHDVEHRMYGYDFPSVRERQDRLEEAVQVVRLLFESEATRFVRGAHYRLHDAVLRTRTAPAPRPPIVIGGEGERTDIAHARPLRRCDGLRRHTRPAAARRSQCWSALPRCRPRPGRDHQGVSRPDHGERQPAAGRPGRRDDGAAVRHDARTRAHAAHRNAEHVRDVVERYADAGVPRMIMLTQAPWKHDIYRRISDEVVAAFA